jgi:integrase
VKETLTWAGIDAKDYSGHSLRAGLVTAAAMAGVTERIIMQQTGHKNILCCVATSVKARSSAGMPRRSRHRTPFIVIVMHTAQYQA